MWTCCACLNFRFSDALDQFMKSQTMVSRKIVPGVLTWPTTSQVIEETRKENLQVCLTTKIKILFSQMDIPKKKKNISQSSVVWLLGCHPHFVPFPPLSRPRKVEDRSEEGFCMKQPVQVNFLEHCQPQSLVCAEKSSFCNGKTVLLESIPFTA